MTAAHLFSLSLLLAVAATAAAATSASGWRPRVLAFAADNNNNNNKVKKKEMTEAELIKRRKSPALWRYDLSNSDDSAGGSIDTASRSSQRQEYYPASPPEIMSPVGYFPQLHAAIANGADSVYLGTSAFSARARASNFDVETELPTAVQIAHDAGVKVYVALNTLVFNHELSEVATLIQQIDAAGVDALIVQDLGVCKLVQNIAPRLELHASTQQSVTSADGVRHASTLGATRVVLGRELSLDEIDKVNQDVRMDNELLLQQADAANGDAEPVETEVFVHGALCVSYSGQCFSSEAWGGRSANRGQCAQACRLPYGLVTDGVLTNLGDVEYLLSPQDLCGVEATQQLVRSGVSCLKIEGRLKAPEYVAATTRAYRNAIDEAWTDMQQERFDKGLIDEEQLQKELQKCAKGKSLSNADEVVSKSELTQLFSRGQDETNDGLTPGFFEGVRHQRLVRGRSPRHRGIHIGRVSLADGSSPKRGIVITSPNEAVLSSLKRGDGLVIDRGAAQEEELGGPLYDVSEVWRDYDSNGYAVEIKFGRDVMSRWARHDGPIRKRRGGNEKLLVPEEAHVWRTADATVDKKIRRLAESAPPRQLVHISVTGKVGEPLEVIIESMDGRRRSVGLSEGPLEAAEGSGLEASKVIKAIGQLGGTAYSIQGGSIDLDGLEEGVWCPMGWIKSARRDALEAFDNARSIDEDNGGTEGPKGFDPKESLQKLISDATADSVDDSSGIKHNQTEKTRLSILARTYEQVDRICQMIEEGGQVDEIIIDFLEVDGMKQAVSRIRKIGDVKAIVASPRIVKPGECGIWRTLLRLEPDGLLIRSAGLVHRMKSLGGEGASVNLASKSRGEEDHFVKIPLLIGDFSLNPTNLITAGELLSEGLARITAAYDLNANAITDLAEGLGNNAERLDVIAHCHIPIFHTEHCVFARFLSEGNSYVDCGHACTRHNVHLRDQTGADNLVLADMGCRNTVFTAQAQSGVHSLKEWKSTGIGRLRIELVDENADDAERVVKTYLEVMSDDLRPRDAWERLEKIRDSNGREGGVSLGSLKNGVERRAGELSSTKMLDVDVY